MVDLWTRRIEISSIIPKLCNLRKLRLILSTLGFSVFSVWWPLKTLFSHFRNLKIFHRSTVSRSTFRIPEKSLAFWKRPKSSISSLGCEFIFPWVPFFSKLLIFHNATVFSPPERSHKECCYLIKPFPQGIKNL